MLRFVLRRAAFSAGVLLVVSAAIFLLTHLVPGSPAIIVLGADASAEQVREFERRYGFDRPLAVQYLGWLRGILLHGDFGQSYISGQPIAAELARTLPVTLEIVIVAFLFCLAVSLPLGILSALYQGRLLDHVARIFAVVGVSVPGFWLGLMLIVYGAVHLRLFPPGGFTPWSAGIGPHLLSVVLPALALGVYYTAIVSRMTRSSVIEVAAQDYIRTARAMGLSRRRVLLYALKNALIPVVSVSAMSVGYMFGWAIIIEQVFNIAGLSRALLSAIFQRDYYTVQAVVLVITTVFVAANLAADVVYRLLDPRIRGVAA